jgi:hypothetical protein
LVFFFKTPFQSIKAIPSNWWRNIACIDITHMPEPLPGIETATSLLDSSKLEDAKFLHPSMAFKLILESGATEDWLIKLLRWTIASLFTLFVVLPAWLYRWSLKGTFLLYSPLVWVAHRSFADNPWDRLRDIRELAFHRLVRGYSVLVLFLLFARVALDVLYPSWSALWTKLPSAALLDVALAPHSLPVWQLAMSINAVMAWVLYFFADWALARHRRGRPPNNLIVDDGIRAVWLIRTTLSVYVISNGLYAAATLASVLPG